MTTFTMQSNHVSRPRHVVPGSIITITPQAGAQVTVEYTYGSLSDINNGAALWLSWSRGTVISPTADMVQKGGFMRFTPRAGSAVIDINENPSQASIDSFKRDWSYEFSDVIYCSGTPNTLTGVTTKQVLASVYLPAGRIGPNTSIEIESAFALAATTNAKTVDVAIGISPASTSSLFNRARSAANQVGESPKITITGRGVLNSQVMPYTANSSYGTGVSLIPETRTIDFSVDQYIYCFGTLANAADFIRLDSLVVTLRNPSR